MKWLITGGSGFIGCNAADRLTSEGHDVAVYDDLSREGSRDNLEWLQQRGLWTFYEADVRNAPLIGQVVEFFRPDVVLHLAAQTAVTTSITNPRDDFGVNVGGTLNVLEAVRTRVPEAVVIFSSTNKVYGDVGERPVSEAQPLDPRTPYGVSKAAADLYCLDYARTYGLRTVVFRQSCCYGERQTGSEDQGWVAWFARAAMTGQPITIYGDGYQVRDLLHVDDLVEAYTRVATTPSVWGQAFNVGGGPKNTKTLLAVLSGIGSRGYQAEVSYAAARPGDQRTYISDTGKLWDTLKWAPKIGVTEGLDRLIAWLAESPLGVAGLPPSLGDDLPRGRVNQPL